LRLTVAAPVIANPLLLEATRDARPRISAGHKAIRKALSAE
jgi:hypothetical protein